MGFFDTLFGKKPTSQVQSQVQNGPPIQQPLPQKQENSWIYELIVEYLTSPIWKITITQFLDDHCLVFDGEEENKIEYIGIHKKFKKMMEGLVDGMLQELMIDEQSFMEQVEKGLKHEKHKKIFEQLLIIDNFLVFKMMMVKRNKELELEALKEIQKQDIQRQLFDNIKKRNVNVQANADQIKQLELQKEKAEIDHAIALSKAVEEERKRLLQKEQDDFNLAIMQSQAEYQAMLKQQEEELKRKMKMEELKQQKELAEQRMRDNLQHNKVQIQPKEQPNYIVDLSEQQQQQQQPQVIQQIQHKDDTPTPIQMSNNLQQEQRPSMLGVYGQPLQIHQFPEVQQAAEVKQQQEIKPQQIPEIKPLAPLGKHLPPIKPNIVQAESHIVFEEDDEQKQKDEEIRRKQIEMLKSQKSGDVQEESLEERKKRFMIQREQLRKKKQDEREKELNQYKEQQQAPDTKVQSENDPQKQSFDLQRKNTQEELQRRKEQLEQKRKQLLLQKQQQKQEDYEVDLL